MSYSNYIHNKSLLKGIPELAFNNTYDVDFVEKHADDIRMELYTYCLKIQQERGKLGFVNGSMREFKKNRSIALVFDLPLDTYFAKVDNTFLHYFSEKSTLYQSLPEDPVVYSNQSDIASGRLPYYNLLPKIGCKFNKYSMLDVCKKSNVFNRRLLFFIGNQLYIDVQFIPTKACTYLAILPNFLPESFINECIANDTRWGILESPTGKYFINKAYSPSDITTGNTADTMILRHDFNLSGGGIADISSGCLVATPASGNASGNLLNVTFASIVKTDSANVGYSVAKKFVDNSVIKQTNAAGLMIVFTEGLLKYHVNIPCRKNIKSATPSGVFQLPLKNSPIPPENLLVFVNNPDGSISPVPDANIQLWYPNVYQVTDSRLETGDSDMQVLAYRDDSCGCRFVNPIQNYMDFRGNQYIHECITNTLPYPITRYLPLVHTRAPEDYYGSKYSLNNAPSQYTIDKYIWMLLDDPNRYISLFNDVKALTAHNTYTYEFAVSDIGLLSRKCQSTDEILGNPDKYVSKRHTFAHPMTWITVNADATQMVPVDIFINGNRILDTYVMMLNGIQYIFFDWETVNLNADKNMVIHIMRPSSITQNSAANPLIFKKDGDRLPIPEQFTSFSDQNVIFYDADTKDYIPNSDFYYGLSITVEKDFFRTSDKEYLKTSENEFVITGSNILIGNKHAATGEGFYKYVGTRSSSIQFELTGTTIYDTVYRNNGENVKNPVSQKEWDEDMLCISITTDNACYPAKLFVDDHQVPVSEVYRYFEYDLSNKQMVEYVYFPRKYATANSIVLLSTLIANKWEFLANEVSFQNTAEIYIANKNPDNLNRKIIMQSSDFYRRYDISIENANSIVMDANFIGEASPNRFRVWAPSDTGYIRIPEDDVEFIFDKKHSKNLSIKCTKPAKYPNGLVIEYMPFKENLAAVVNILQSDPNHCASFERNLDRPIASEVYDIYCNGKRLDHTMYRPYATSSVVFNGIDTKNTFKFYEISHDTDVYGNMYRNKTLEEELIEINPEFKRYMTEKAFAK